MSQSRDLVAFANLIDLASDRLGGEALLCSDDFFASVDNLVKDAEPEFDPDAYYERGKVMDGWESRRRRTPGHDWAIVRLGVEGELQGVDIDTAFFMGNHGPFASLEACNVPADTSAEALRDEVEWTEILPQVPLQRGSHNLFAVSQPGPWTHLRLRMFPDGGIARLRAYGVPKQRTSAERVDLAALANGGRPVACSDMFFSPMSNLISPGDPENMGQGWESRRRRDDGYDWIVVKLGVPGHIDEALLDTMHFKGNYPDRAWLEGIWWPDAPDSDVLRAEGWQTVLPAKKLRAHHKHSFDLGGAGPFTHVRLNIAPCGGVARMRLWGRAGEPDASADALLSGLAALDEGARVEAFSRCCGASRWAAAMAKSGPFTSRAHLYGEALRQWWLLDVTDWKEAFTHHPQIGADVEKLREKFASTSHLAENEQAGVAGASETTLRALAQANTDYLVRFGYIFIVCATGKTATEMLELLEQRMHNTPENELRIAAGEQAKITRLRLDALEGALS